MAKPANIVNPLAGTPSNPQCKPMDNKDKSRERKLAEALRENLRRRKAQARELKPEERPKRD